MDLYICVGLYYDLHGLYKVSKNRGIGGGKKLLEDASYGVRRGWGLIETTWFPTNTNGVKLMSSPMQIELVNNCILSSRKLTSLLDLSFYIELYPVVPLIASLISPM